MDIMGVCMKSLDDFFSIKFCVNMGVWVAGSVLVLLLFELGRDVAVSVEEMLESLDAVLDEVLECVLLVLLVLCKLILMLAGVLPYAISGGIETSCESLPLGLDLLRVALDGLCGEVPDPCLDTVYDGVGVVVLVGASSIGLSLGLFEEGADIVLEVMVLDLADLQLDSLVCGLDVSFLLGQACINLGSGDGNLRVHGLISEGLECGNSHWACLFVVLVELQELSINPLGSVSFMDRLI